MEIVALIKILNERGWMKVNQLDMELDLHEEMREKVVVKMASKQKATEYFNRRVRSRVFQMGDFV